MALIVSLGLLLLIALCNAVVIHPKHNSLINRKNKQIHDTHHDFDQLNAAHEIDDNILFENENDDEYIDYEHDTLDNNQRENNYNSAMMDYNNGDYDSPYSDKDQTTAFVLTFFLGAYGAGRFYIGDNAIGTAKLCFTLMICCAVCICSYFVFKAVRATLPDDIVGTQRTNPLMFGPCIPVTGVTTLIACCGLIAIALWWLYDVILFGMNDVYDSNGKELIPW
eukprot:111388_1